MASRFAQLQSAILPPIVAFVLRSVLATLRVRHSGSGPIDGLNASGRNYIMAFWHSDNLYAVFSRVKLPAVPVISHHRDGEMMVRLMQRFGVTDFARGSSTRGGAAALRELLRWARKGANLAIAPDGPRGPVYEVKEGVIAAARMAGIPIVPMRFHPERCIEFSRSWDHSRLPLPFSRALYIYGDPVEVDRNATTDELEHARLRLQRSMNEIRERAAVDFERLWHAGLRENEGRQL